ncbi:hypothetical protein GWI33_003114 [Rhynchophorus ferrugineus]|uniref:Uncharacterized protein n=1 Tax=Rhynchophorus ferrugineus TaxID=354439 RepID=A0A834MFY8_RHYFE|nr:hypothetical protein GWI33_003114 [Rhynchophorus ferrugineus]
MRQTSKTGLTASTLRKLPYHRPQQINVQLKTIAVPAPFAWKPYSGFYNPYAPGCSLLCNHPVDQDAKDLLRKAKDSWTNKTVRSALLDDELESIRTGLNQLSFRERTNNFGSQVESVPEELFRRYTETDSRPLTPAPTLASAATRASATRRCVTPEAGPRNGKARLVLDLRRTHSQETISYSASLQDPPLIRIQHVPTKTVSLEHLPQFDACPSRRSLPVQTPRKVKTAVANVKPDKHQPPELIKPEENERKDEEPEEVVKRRGKKKKKKERDASRGPPAFQASLDPETLVATIGADSVNPSARASLVPCQAGGDNQTSAGNGKRRSLKPRRSLDVDSYLDAEILKQLRRELNEEMVDSELNPKRRKALQEALKVVSKDKRDCEELVALQKELKLPPLNTDLWISLPRTFTRSSARFELPMDSGSLSKMTPLTYAREHVFISSGRKLLFNCVFNKFKMEADLENEYDRKLAGSALQDALDLLMGRPMMQDEAVYFRNLIGWMDDDVFDFRTFCGVAALCERIMAPAYCPRLPDRKEDPCHEIETADFEVLERKLCMQEPNPMFFELLQCLKTK